MSLHPSGSGPATFLAEHDVYGVDGSATPEPRVRGFISPDRDASHRTDIPTTNQTSVSDQVHSVRNSKTSALIHGSA